ncbi:hypothetical protein VTI74DRAFT_1867 [Chaetomium olivicolor]
MNFHHRTATHVRDSRGGGLVWIGDLLRHRRGWEALRRVPPRLDAAPAQHQSRSGGANKGNVVTSCCSCHWINTPSTREATVESVALGQTMDRQCIVNSVLPRVQPSSWCFLS